MSHLSTYYSWKRFFGTLSAVQVGLRNLVDLLDAKFYARSEIYLPFAIPAAELAAGTSIEVVMPHFEGYVTGAVATVQTAIVTGGVLTFQIGATDITGLSLTLADAATKGTTAADTPTDPTSSNGYVVQNGRIQVTPSAAFAGGGAVSGFIKIRVT